MNALIFDCFSGASGDMIISSLIDAGADLKCVKSAMESAADVSVHIEKVSKNGISATKVDVVEHGHAVRSYRDVVEHVKKNVDADVIADVLAIFKRIGEAEAKVHGKDLQDMHFHEVGADDAIADVVGAVTAIKNLGVDAIYCTPITTGSGFVNTSHGTFPVPAPATMEILMNSPLKVVTGDTKHELLTPTGAAILSHFVSKCEAYDRLLPLKVTGVGYGAGGLDLDYPNVLRVVIGVIDDVAETMILPGTEIVGIGIENGAGAGIRRQLHETTCGSRLHHDEIMMLETNVDDSTGEVLGNLINELVGMGAKDALIIPATMKKGRCGHVLKVIAKSDDVDRLAYKIVMETGSLGVRVIPVSHRLIAHRRMEDVKVTIGGNKYSAHVKVALDGCGALLGISAEFDDCREIAQQEGVAVKEVMRRVEEAAWKGFGEMG